jgi:hypothetical protein
MQKVRITIEVQEGEAAAVPVTREVFNVVLGALALAQKRGVQFDWRVESYNVIAYGDETANVPTDAPF